MSWTIDEIQCDGIRKKIDAVNTDLGTEHKNLSGSIDQAAGLFTDDKFSKIANALNGAFNICLAPNMANVEAQVSKASSSLNGVTAALHNGQVAIAEQLARDSKQADPHVHVNDAKPVK